MSVETSGRKTTQSMTISLIDYAFTFRALFSTPSDIKCIRTITATGVDTDMTYVTEIPSPSDATDVLKYLVDVNEDGIGGTIKVMWPSTGCTITIYRETSNVQSSDYEDYNQFPAETVENDFDKRTLKSQEMQEDIDRALKVAITAPTSGSLPTGEANKFIGWDSTGKWFENKTVATGGTILVKAAPADAIAKTDDVLYMTPYLVGLAARTVGSLIVTTDATIPIAIITNLTVSTITIAGSTSTITDTQSKSMTVESPHGTEDISMFYVDKAVTVDKIICVIAGTTPSITWGVNHGTDRSGAGTSVITATTISTTTGDSITAFADATIPAESYVWFVSTATSGTITALNMTVNFKQDA